jgi:hypothetical protein
VSVSARPGVLLPRNETERKEEAMAAVELDFDIPEPIGGVKRWFLETLRPLAGVPHREKPGVELVLREPTARKLDDPETDTTGTEIVITAYRKVTARVPSDWCPEYVIEPRETEELDLGRVMVFRLCALGGETYVWASGEERPSTAWKIFEDFLKQIEARYPRLGPFWKNVAEQHRERMREELKAAFGDTPPEPPADPEPERPGEAAPPRRRGRKRTDPKEINQICADWCKVQDRETQDIFCSRKGISPSCLRRWLKRYPYPES